MEGTQAIQNAGCPFDRGKRPSNSRKELIEKAEMKSSAGCGMKLAKNANYLNAISMQENAAFGFLSDNLLLMRAKGGSRCKSIQEKVQGEIEQKPRLVAQQMEKHVALDSILLFLRVPQRRSAKVGTWNLFPARRTPKAGMVW